MNQQSQVIYDSNRFDFVKHIKTSLSRAMRPALFQRGQSLKLLCIPYIKQFRLMQLGPLSNHSQSLIRKVAFQHFQCLNVDCTQILVIDNVKMRRVVFAAKEVHLYDHSVEPCDYRHLLTSFLNIVYHGIVIMSRD
uniref:Uncharacterized protein n=1 Tax=Dulem virus 33 TaxID=3145751 RepID=A0AAU8B7W7_9CAUD